MVIQKLSYRSVYLLLLSLTFILEPLLSAAHHSSYKVKNLVSDIPGLAPQTDSRLINPWGLTFSPKGNLLVANNGTDLATAYRPNGEFLNFFFIAAGAPTGVERNNCNDAFLIDTIHAAQYLLSTESGTILAFNRKVDPNNAILVIDRSSEDAVYKGIAIGEIDGEKFLYATDFRNARIDVFDSQFNYRSSFTDPTIPAGFAPFNIRNFHGRLYVTYALQEGPENEDDLPGPGNGFVDVFSPEGLLLKRLISQGALNSPWGLAIAPNNFGEFSGALLVGNFGDGRINAYCPRKGTFLGQLLDRDGNPIVIDGLWSLKFRERRGRGEERSCACNKKRKAILYFTAGLNDESNGLLGIIQFKR